MPDSRIDEAQALAFSTRLGIMRRFFDAHPGSPDGPPGLGRAALDFAGWLGGSGRLDDTSGSAWWRAVNGCLVLDLADALTPHAAAGGTAPAWRTYAASADGPGRGQELFWRAHQESLHGAIPACHELLTREPAGERDFVACAIEIVDLAALRGQPTDSDALGLLTRRLYPDHYPLTEPLSADLRHLRAAALKRHAGPRVGLDSGIWADAWRVTG